MTGSTIASMPGSIAKTAAICTGVALAACAMTAHAQFFGGQRDPGDSGIVRCESGDNRTRECPVDTQGGVRLVRQLSKAPCVEGQTWGYGRGGIWVTQGCRGEFALGYGGAYGRGYGGGGGDIFRCESAGTRWNECAIPGGGDVALVRQLSRSACVEEQSWGRRGNRVWVANGCRAEFRSIPRGWGGRSGGARQVVRCESNGGGLRQCPIDADGGVRLLRQLSNAACVEGRTWGTDGFGIWVSQGCRGEFEVGVRGYPGGGYRGGDGSGWQQGMIECASRDGRLARCAIPVRGGVQLVRQLSQSACVQGQSWGWDGGGVWVANGCRARFSVW